MREMIYKFLDNYLGDEVFCVKGKPSEKYDTYGIISKKDKSVILSFNIIKSSGGIVIFRGGKLTNTVSSFFSMNPDDVSRIIRDWFGDKHNIKKMGDLMKFVN